MKLNFIVLAATAMMSINAFASDYTYICEQRKDRTPIDSKIGKINVVVTYLKTIATGIDYRGEYADSVDSVKVAVTATKNGKKTVVRATNAIAVSEDVIFNINSNGIAFRLYMDELEESSISLMVNGKKKEIDLSCN
jgi:hypothetical protein